LKGVSISTAMKKNRAVQQRKRPWGMVGLSLGELNPRLVLDYGYALDSAVPGADRRRLDGPAPGNVLFFEGLRCWVMETQKVVGTLVTVRRRRDCKKPLITKSTWDGEWTGQSDEEAGHVEECSFQMSRALESICDQRRGLHCLYQYTIADGCSHRSVMWVKKFLLPYPKGPVVESWCCGAVGCLGVTDDETWSLVRSTDHQEDLNRLTAKEDRKRWAWGSAGARLWALLGWSGDSAVPDVYKRSAIPAVSSGGGGNFLFLL
jgi:hypothetical protein